jgi:FixJ family two-component response regulator
MLASLRMERPSCLLLDIQLPDINGFELQQELATKDIQIPIIFLTGHGDIPMSVRAIKAGALEFLTKPFDDEYLLEAIRSAIAPLENLREQQASALAYFDAFLIFTALAIGLAFLVLLMKRSATQKGQHVAAE